MGGAVIHVPGTGMGVVLVMFSVSSVFRDIAGVRGSERGKRMKAEVLQALVKQGKRPLVRLTDNSLNEDSFGNEGMIARVITASDTDQYGVIVFEFDYNENKEHNLALQSHGYYLHGDSEGKTGTIFEAGLMKESDIREKIYADAGEEFNLSVELIAEDTPLGEYIASGSKVPYVEWLEGKLEELVPDCMKTWKKGI